MDKGPCSNCEDRKVLCHSTCDRYKEYRNSLDDKKDTIRRAKSKESEIVRYYKDIGKNNKSGKR